MYPLSKKFLVSSCRKVPFWGTTDNLPGLLGGTQLWHLPSLLMKRLDPGGQTGARLLWDAQSRRVQSRCSS